MAKKNQTMMGCFLLILVGIALVIYFASRQAQLGSAARPEHLKNPPSGLELPQHEFVHSVRGRSQIRAVVEGDWTPEKLKKIAVQLAEHNQTDPPAYLVQFFDDAECLARWNGTGAVQGWQERHYLGQVVVDAKDGNLYARVFTPSPYPMR